MQHIKLKLEKLLSNDMQQENCSPLFPEIIRRYFRNEARRQELVLSASRWPLTSSTNSTAIETICHKNQDFSGVTYSPFPKYFRSFESKFPAAMPEVINVLKKDSRWQWSWPNYSTMTPKGLCPNTIKEGPWCAVPGLERIHGLLNQLWETAHFYIKVNLRVNYDCYFCSIVL